MNEALEISLLARLLIFGTLKAGVRNQALLDRFRHAHWIRPSVRRSEWELLPSARSSALGRLEILLPTWQQDQALLEHLKRSLFNASDVAALPMLRRAPEAATKLLNRRNWYAAAGLGPKHQPKLQANCTLTTDWILRFRPNIGLIAITSDASRVDLYERRLAGEFPMPERYWMFIERLEGNMPRVVITCENKGAYVDLPVDSTTLVVFAPGAEITPAVRFLNKIPVTVPWFHFGDIDDRGIEIGKQLAEKLGRQYCAFVPEFASEYLEHSKPHKSSWNTRHEGEVVNHLASTKSRLFQEVFMTDIRLGGNLKNFIDSLTRPSL